MADEAPEGSGRRPRRGLSESSQRALDRMAHRLASELELPREASFTAARAILCAVERRVAGDDGLEIETLLPPDVTGLFARCERHYETDAKTVTSQQFLRDLGAELSMDEGELERAVRGVLEVLREQLDETDQESLQLQLPPDLVALWQRAV
jgi:uncharacterized protein (DUF2267 family)